MRRMQSPRAVRLCVRDVAARGTPLLLACPAEGLHALKRKLLVERARKWLSQEIVVIQFLDFAEGQEAVSTGYQGAIVKHRESGIVVVMER